MQHFKCIIINPAVFHLTSEHLFSLKISFQQESLPIFISGLHTHEAKYKHKY